MEKTKSITLIVLLCCQLAFASVAMAFSSSHDNIHQSFSHDQNINHHHHDAFSTHIGDNGGEQTHQHFSDSPPPAGIIHLESIGLTRIGGQFIPAFNPLAPPEIFLESPLRPPRTKI